ncbi:divergent polysaccharide deacetylase family protein [Paramagnetospirillum caucaseum]|nr:divergent polysaccharide deacetylase family protein [Paramagnetospirillum caucaseum]
MGNKRPLWERPVVLVGLMAAVLVIGVGIGLGVGLWSGNSSKAPQPGAEQAPAPVVAASPPPRPGPSSGDDDEGRPLLAPPPPRPDPGSSEALEFGHASDVVALAPMPPPPQPAPEIKLPPAGAAVWLRNAQPPPKTGGRPVIAIIIDDLGVDRRRSERMAQLKAPLTLSYMTYAEDVARQAHDARGHGHELMVHVPMQPQSASYDPGPEVLEVGLAADEIRRRLDWGLSRFDGYVGINNHMGSRFTSDPAGMRVVMGELRRRGLAFIDSVTSERTVGAETARHYGVPFASRHVFLDNDQGVAHVRAQLAKTEAYARKHGAAIAIGHPHDGTIEALAGWLPGLEARGFALVPVSAIIRMGNGQ